MVINPLDGGATTVSTFGDTGAFYGLSSNKSKLYTVQGTTVYLVDPGTGELTEITDYAGSNIGAAYGSTFPGEAK